MRSTASVILFIRGGVQHGPPLLYVEAARPLDRLCYLFVRGGLSYGPPLLFIYQRWPTFWTTSANPSVYKTLSFSSRHLEELGA